MPTSTAQYNRNHWRKLRRNVFSSQDHLCADCSYRLPLELHHLTYQPPVRCKMDINHPPEIYTWETGSDVVGLCRDCHQGRHIATNGEFFRDPEDVEFIDGIFEDCT